MELNIKTISIAIASVVALTGAVYLVSKFRSEDKVEETVSDDNTVESSDKADALSESADEIKMALEGFDMSNLYEADGSLNTNVRSALSKAILHYIQNEDLTSRAARKDMPFLWGIEDVALRNELTRITKRIVGLYYVACRSTPDIVWDITVIDEMLY